MAKLRLCKVNGELAYFHCWGQYYNVIPPSPMLGGHSGGQCSQVLAVVELYDGQVKEVTPGSIQFIDETSAFLAEMKKYNDDVKENSDA